MGIYDVPIDELLKKVAEEFKTKIKKPEFTKYVKTGQNRQRAPNNPDWFYLRMASILYRIYKEGALGTGALRAYYGGRQNRGVKPEHKKKASGKIIRVCLQTLEKEKLVKKDKKGRTITPQGEKLLYTKAKEIEKTLNKEEKNE
ncbi:MAG: 30S ribosomal protein S19e [Candidatus Diapherotrites archaeon]